MTNNDIRRSRKAKEWRRKVRRRDHYTCQLCQLRRSKTVKIKLHVHHIVRFTDDESLRFILENGVTLCSTCHRLTYGKEGNYTELFNEILSSKCGSIVK